MRRLRGWTLLALGVLVPCAAAQVPALAAAIPAEEFARRQAAVAERFAGEVVIIPAEQLGSGMAAIDANAPLLDFTYLVGRQLEGAVLVLGAPGGPILFAPESADGIDTVRPVSRFDEFAREVFQPGDVVRLWESGGPQTRRIRGLLAEHGVELRGGVRRMLAALRLAKSEAELSLIRHASEVTNQAHRDVQAALRPGMNEREVQEIIERRFREMGCARTAFPCIVGSGPNSCIPHYHRNERVMQEGELVVVDIGAEFGGYATDITRTYPVGGTFTDRQREIYAIVREAQAAAEEILRPGVALRELDAAARRVITARGYGRYFIHATSHFVGLSVHDVGSYAEPLPVGAVVTIEPGIYVRHEALGVRIEDIYVVMADGYERLSAGAPREIEEIERRD